MRRFRSNGGLRTRALVAGSLALGLVVAPRQAAGQKPGLPMTAPDGLGAVASTSEECCHIVLLPIGARQTAMGRAVAPLSSPEAVFYNPAGLAEVEGWHFAVHHVESNVQPYDAFTLLFTPGNLAVFGVSYALLDYGDQELTGPDDIAVGRISAADHLFIASFASTVLPGLSTGINYKYDNFRINCSGECQIRDLSGVSHMLDLGLQYQPIWFERLRLGLALLNVGTPMQVINADQASPAPTRLRLGAAYDVLHHFDSVGPYALTVLVEAQEDDWKQPTSPRTSFGFEASVADFVFLRAGYGAGGEGGLEGGPAVGLGVVYSRFNVSVAKRVDDGIEGDQPFQLTIDIGF